MGPGAEERVDGEVLDGAVENDDDDGDLDDDDDDDGDWEELTDEEEAELAAAYEQQAQALAQVPPNPTFDPADADAVAHLRERLAAAPMTPLAQILDASNGVLLVRLEDDEGVLHAVYKPTIAETPLWDFPPMTLAQREVATYEIACAAGLFVIPPTVLREDGSHGPGSVQWFVSAQPAPPPVDVVAPDDVADDQLPVLHAETAEGEPLVVVHRDAADLRAIALLDVIANNADRKGSALLTGHGRLWGIDHGICLHAEPKLRTVLWGWAGEPFTESEQELLADLAAQLDEGPLAARLAELLLPEEVDALRDRVAVLLAAGQWPLPSPGRPAIPWPVL